MSSKHRTIYELIHRIYCPTQMRREARSMRYALLSIALVILVFTGPLVSTTSDASPPLNSSFLPPNAHRLSLGSPNVTLTYTSRWNSTETLVHAGDRLAGDHIVLHARWDPSTDIVQSIISVNATVVPKEISAENASATVSIDTRALGNNFTCKVNMTAVFANDTVTSTIVDDVFLGNFFAPEVQVISPNGGEVWVGVNNVTWIASDKNSDETLTFDIFLSPDSGRTLMLLASGVNRTWYLWDCSTFTQSSSYVIAIRAFDGIYYSMDMSDGNFTAGGIASTTTTVTTTLPTSTTTTTTAAAPTAIAAFEGPILTFLMAALISSVAMALFVYYSAKRWI